MLKIAPLLPDKFSRNFILMIFLVNPKQVNAGIVDRNGAILKKINI